MGEGVTRQKEKEKKKDEFNNLGECFEALYYKIQFECKVGHVTNCKRHLHYIFVGDRNS